MRKIIAVAGLLLLFLMVFVGIRQMSAHAAVESMPQVRQAVVATTAPIPDDCEGREETVTRAEKAIDRVTRELESKAAIVAAAGTFDGAVSQVLSRLRPMFKDYLKDKPIGFIQNWGLKIVGYPGSLAVCALITVEGVATELFAPVCAYYVSKGLGAVIGDPLKKLVSSTELGTDYNTAVDKFIDEIFDALNIYFAGNTQGIPDQKKDIGQLQKEIIEGKKYLSSLESALSDARKALGACPDNPFNVAIFDRIRQGRTDTDDIRIDVQTYTDLLQQAATYQNDINFTDKAIEAYTGLIALGEKYTIYKRDVFYYIRGNLLATKGQYNPALDDYMRSIQLRPKSIYYVQAGNILAAQRQFERAVEMYSNALNLDAEDYWAYYYRANVYGWLKQWDKALSDYRNHVRLAGKNAASFVPGYITLLEAYLNPISPDSLVGSLTQVFVSGKRQDQTAAAVAIPGRWDAQEIPITDGSGYLSPTSYQFVLTNSTYYIGPALKVNGSDPVIKPLDSGTTLIQVYIQPTQRLNPKVGTNADPLQTIAVANDSAQALIEGPSSVKLGDKRGAYLYQRYTQRPQLARLFIAKELGNGMTAFILCFFNLNEYATQKPLMLAIAATLNLAPNAEPYGVAAQSASTVVAPSVTSASPIVQPSNSALPGDSAGVFERRLEPINIQQYAVKRVVRLGQDTKVSATFSGGFISVSTTVTIPASTVESYCVVVDPSVGFRYVIADLSPSLAELGSSLDPNSSGTSLVTTNRFIFVRGTGSTAGSWRIIPGTAWDELNSYSQQPTNWNTLCGFKEGDAGFEVLPTATPTITPTATASRVPASAIKGPQILYTNGRVNQIFAMNVDGTANRPLTENTTLDSQASWSPDGKQIAFISERDGNPELYIMDADGSHQKRITTTPTDESEPVWSPDGKQIAFVAGTYGERNLFVIDSDGNNRKQAAKFAICPAWSPDGTQIAFLDNVTYANTVFVANLARGTTASIYKSGDFWATTCPVWSKTSSQLYVYGDARSQRQSGLFAFNVGVSTPILLLKLGEGMYPEGRHISVAPDGKTILSNEERFKFVTLSGLDGSNKKRAFIKEGWQASWYPSGFIEGDVLRPTSTPTATPIPTNIYSRGDGKFTFAYPAEWSVDDKTKPPRVMLTTKSPPGLISLSVVVGASEIASAYRGKENGFTLQDMTFSTDALKINRGVRTALSYFLKVLTQSDELDGGIKELTVNGNKIAIVTFQRMPMAPPVGDQIFIMVDAGSGVPALISLIAENGKGAQFLDLLTNLAGSIKENSLATGIATQTSIPNAPSPTSLSNELVSGIVINGSVAANMRTQFTLAGRANETYTIAVSKLNAFSFDVEVTLVGGLGLPLSRLKKISDGVYQLTLPSDGTYSISVIETGGTNGLFSIVASLVISSSATPPNSSPPISNTVVPTNMPTTQVATTRSTTQQTVNPLLAVYAKSGPASDIFLFDPVTGDRTNLTNKPARYSEVDWSPDGRRLAFRSDRDNPKINALEVFVVNADGTGLINLSQTIKERELENYSGGGGPTWSPDGKFIAFGSNRLYQNVEWRGTDIYIVASDGSRVTNLTPDSPQWDFYPRWSPDGRTIAFFYGTDIYLMDANGSNRRMIQTGDAGDNKADLSWSPDGTRLLYMSYTKGMVSDNVLIRTVEIADGKVTNLTPQRNAYEHPSWSPDGKSVALLAIDYKKDKRSIQVVDLATLNNTNLTTQNVVEPSALDKLSWSPDSQSIVYIASKGSDIYQLKIDGSGSRLLTQGFGAVWQPVGTSFSIVASSTTPATPTKTTTIISPPSTVSANVMTATPLPQTITLPASKLLILGQGVDSTLPVNGTVDFKLDGGAGESYEINISNSPFAATEFEVQVFPPVGSALPLTLNGNSIYGVTLPRPGIYTIRVTEKSGKGGNFRILVNAAALLASTPQPVIPAMTEQPTSVAQQSSSTPLPSSIPSKLPPASAAPTTLPAITSVKITLPTSEQQVIDTDTIWILFGGQRDIFKPAKLTLASPAFVAKPLMLRYRWCANSEAKRTAILTPFSIQFYVDGVEIAPSQILVFDRLTQQKEYCRFYATLLSNWPQGSQVVLKVIFTLTQAVNDGKTNFAAGTYETEITMNVKGTNGAAPVARTATPIAQAFTTKEAMCPGSLAPRLVIGGQGRVLPGDPNNLNSKPSRPSLDSTSKKLASIPGGGVFTVLEGPTCNQGITWWKINYNGIEGWTGESDTKYWVEPSGKGQ